METMLTSEAKEFYDKLIADFEIPFEEQPLLEMGVYYLFEWRKLAKLQNKNYVKLDHGHNDTPRAHPERVYEQKCYERWLQVCTRFGFDPIGKKKVGKAQDPKTKTKKQGRGFRKVVNI